MATIIFYDVDCFLSMWSLFLYCKIVWSLSEVIAIFFSRPIVCHFHQHCWSLSTKVLF